VFEILIPFAAGYLFARLLTVERFKCERILGWNRDCLGWRPVTSADEVKPENKYLACFEVDPETAQRFQTLMD